MSVSIIPLFLSSLLLSSPLSAPSMLTIYKCITSRDDQIQGKREHTKMANILPISGFCFSSLPHRNSKNDIRAQRGGAEPRAVFRGLLQPSGLPGGLPAFRQRGTKR